MHIRPARMADRQRLLELWERSVRATHHFLEERDIEALRPLVASELASDAVDWWVLSTGAEEPIGFLGVAGDAIEALFIDPDRRRQGGGRLLVAHAQNLSAGALVVDVNEQNEAAVRFYEALGFAVVERSPTDAGGRPFPIVRMRRPGPSLEQPAERGMRMDVPTTADGGRPGTTSPGERAPSLAGGAIVKRNHAVVRVTHWLSALAITVMVSSGLRIFNAYPAFARKGETFCCYPWAGKRIPASLTFGAWLAGARNWHFAMMWVLVVTGLVYLGFLFLHGEWRDVVPRRGDARDAWEMARFYLFRRADHPVQGRHNAMQKTAYFAMLVVAILIVLSGLAIWKPVSLGWLTALFGGYVWARYWHFVGMALLVLLILAHVVMVLAVDPYAIRSMLTGWYDERLSPEARNARPFYHLLPRWGRTPQRTAPAMAAPADATPKEV